VSVTTQIVKGIMENFNSKLCKLNSEDKSSILFCILGRSIRSGIEILRGINYLILPQIQDYLNDATVTMDSLIAFDAEIAKSIIRKTTYYPEYFEPELFFDKIVKDCFEQLGIVNQKNTYLLSDLSKPDTPVVAINKSYEASQRQYIVNWIGSDKWIGLLKFRNSNKLHTFDLWKKNKHDPKKIGIALSFLYELVLSVERQKVDDKYVVNPIFNSSIGYIYFNQLQILLNGI
jgi:hypothetical protein